MVHRSHIHYYKKYEKRIWTKNTQFPLEQQEIGLSWHLAQVSIWKVGLGILDIDIQLNSSKIKWIQSLLNPTNSLWKDITVYQLNLILYSTQGLALFRQTHKSLGLPDIKTYKNKTIEMFLYSCLILGYISPTIILLHPFI